MSAFVKKHHVRHEICSTRAKYREGRELKAVKVYTINDESQYLLVQGVPALGTQRDLIKAFSHYGSVEDHKTLHEYPAEAFTEVYLIKYENIQSARVAKRKMDDSSFYGGVLHVCYAPEYETMDDTKQKLHNRRITVARRIAQLDAERKKQPSSTITSSPSLDAEHQSLDYPAEHGTLEHSQNQPQVKSCGNGRVPPFPLLPHTGMPPIAPTPPTPTPSYPPPPRHAHTSHDQPGFLPSDMHNFQGGQPLQQQSNYPQFPPQILPPPRIMQPWQQPQPKSCLDHARVPSSHATLPPWENPTISPWQPVQEYESPWQQLSKNLDANRTPCMDEDEYSKHGKTENTRTINKVSAAITKETEEPKQPSIKNNQSSKSIVIKDYKSKGKTPKFVPRQITKKEIPGLNKEAFRRSIKDAVNESLRKNAFILDEMKGPCLPAEEEERRQKFQASDTGDKSMDTSTAAIRSKVRQFSTNLIPRQLKKQKTS